MKFAGARNRWQSRRHEGEGRRVLASRGMVPPAYKLEGLTERLRNLRLGGGKLET